MRQIEFRGKRKADGKWVYGNLIQTYNAFGILQIFGRGEWLVDPDTIGQYMGLPDKNGTKVFEDDILDFGNGIRAVVCWKEDGARFETIPPVEMFEEGYADFCVCGNVHDTPELLGGGA